MTKKKTTMKNQFTWYKLTKSKTKYTMKMDIFVKLDVDHICLDPMPDGNKRYNSLNEKTLKVNLK